MTSENRTYRERREAKAERLREWADKREVKAEATRGTMDQISGMIPLGQPILVGHHSEGRHRRDINRIDNAMRKTVEHTAKAQRMREKADNIENAAKHAIYSDDHDAAERLAEKLAALETKREAIKAKNAEYRKGHREELKGLSAYQKDQVMPFPKYILTNLGGNISRAKKRLAQAQARS